MLSTFQHHTDNGVSKTINLPNTATAKDIYDIYVRAWQMGLKTVSVYRDKSKDVQVLTHGVNIPISATVGSGVTPNFVVTNGNGHLKDRPDVLTGYTHKVPTALGNAYVTVNYTDEGQTPYEVFAAIGKAGSAVSAMAEALGRVVSLALQHNVPTKEIVKQLKGIGDNGSSGWKPSVPAAMGKVLSNYAAFEEGSMIVTPNITMATVAAAPVVSAVIYHPEVATQITATPDLCPECGQGTLMPQARCFTCTSCGFSKC
jgi:ribonucleoside-diphosphate reductase alpha chain